MSKVGTPEEQRKFMYDNVANPDIREKLLQKAWEEENYDEVLRLAKEGVSHDAEMAGLVSDWRKWEFKVYRRNSDKVNTLQLARYFFFNGGGWGEKAYSMEAMYSLMRSIVPAEEWSAHVEILINEASEKRNETRLLFIYTQEKMWDRYMEYLRNDFSAYELDAAPEEVRKLYKDEFIQLYASNVRQFFQGASNRNSYSVGVGLLRNLIKYGGKTEADEIIAGREARTLRRPALINELSEL